MFKTYLKFLNWKIQKSTYVFFNIFVLYILSFRLWHHIHSRTRVFWNVKQTFANKLLNHYTFTFKMSTKMLRHKDWTIIVSLPSYQCCQVVNMKFKHFFFNVWWLKMIIHMLIIWYILKLVLFLGDVKKCQEV